MVRVSVRESIRLHRAGLAVELFDGYRVALWIAPFIRYARRNGWKGRVNSGYRTIAEQQQLWDRYKNSGFNNEFIAAQPGRSNHNYTQYPSGAIDVSDPADFKRAIAGFQGHNGHHLIWAEDVGLKDVVHFSGTGH